MRQIGQKRSRTQIRHRFDFDQILPTIVHVHVLRVRADVRGVENEFRNDGFPHQHLPLRVLPLRFPHLFEDAIETETRPIVVAEWRIVIDQPNRAVERDRCH